MSFSTFLNKKSSFNPFVIGITLLLVSVLILATLFLPEQTTNLLNSAKLGIFANFSWFYVLAFSIFLCVLMILSISNLGNIKLGTNEEEPEFSFVSWLAMLFSAGMGVGLMFFGVAEPLNHFFSSITSGGIEQKQQQALLHTLFHWGIHAWTAYAIIGLALAYFGFRYKLPLALRSCFYPLLKERINGKLGDAIDIMALVATLFGIITTLGFGASQLGAGLVQLGWISENNFALKIIIITIVMTLSTWQAVMWGAILAGVTFILFQQGGIEALQATMLIFSLPFVLLMILMAVSLLKGLRLDLHIRQTDYQHHHWTEQNWRAELTTMLASHDKDASEHYLKHIALPALRELRQELVGIYDLSVHLETDFSLATTLKLTIERTENLAFYYQIERAKTDENYQLLAQSNLIEIPYDIQHFSQNELIADILQQYELYLQEFPH